MESEDRGPTLVVELLPGEIIEQPEPKPAMEPSDAELNARYVTEGVRIVTEQARYPLNQIYSMFTGTSQTESGATEYTYNRDPEYQRRHRWDNTRKSRLIESFLMNVPVPPIFLYENELARYEVMDGRQRLSALIEFYSNSLELSGLQYWPELNGRTYENLPTSIRNGIDRRYLSSIILLNETGASGEQAAFLKKLVFERLNSGGVRLSGQETRNAILNGPLNALCLELSQLPEFKEMLGTPDGDSDTPPEFSDADDSIDDGAENDETPPSGATGNGDTKAVTNLGKKMYKEMEDVEIVLRFFAYRHFKNFSQGLNKLREFLDDFLMKGNHFDTETLAEYRKLFTENIKFWYLVAGAKAFQARGSTRHFSKISFDALMYASSALSDEQRSALLTVPEVVNDAVTEMYAAHADAFGGRKTNATDANHRNEYALAALSTALKRI